VDRQWVRHADGDLYAALSVNAADVRPRAAGRTLHDAALVEALNAVADPITALVIRECPTAVLDCHCRPRLPLPS
jgi:hypothetical protein